MPDIHDSLRGRTVSSVMTDGHRLFIETNCGRTVRIIWKDEDNSTNPGTPIVEGIDAKVVLDQDSLMLGAPIQIRL